MSLSKKTIYTNIAGYLISFVFLYLTFKDINFIAAIDYLSVTNLLYIFLAVGITVLFFIIRGYYQINNLRYINRNISFSSSTASIGIAQFYNVILPARMGELTRVYFLSKKSGINKASLLAYILIEKLLDIFVILLLLLIIITLFINNNSQILEVFLYFLGGIVIITSLISMYLIFNKYFLKFVKNIFPKNISSAIFSLNTGIYSGLKIFKTKEQILKSSALLLLSWMCIIVIYSVITYPYVALFGMPLYSGIIFMVFSVLALSVPSAPAGIGVVHYGLYLAVTIFGNDIVNTEADLVAAFVISTHFFIIMVDILASSGIIAWYKLMNKRSKI